MIRQYQNNFDKQHPEYKNKELRDNSFRSIFLILLGVRKRSILPRRISCDLWIENSKTMFQNFQIWNKSVMSFDHLSDIHVLKLCLEFQDEMETELQQLEKTKKKKRNRRFFQFFEFVHYFLLLNYFFYFFLLFSYIFFSILLPIHIDSDTHDTHNISNTHFCYYNNFSINVCDFKFPTNASFLFTKINTMLFVKIRNCSKFFKGRFLISARKNWLFHEYF